LAHESTVDGDAEERGQRPQAQADSASAFDGRAPDRGGVGRHQVFAFDGEARDLRKQGHVRPDESRLYPQGQPDAEAGNQVGRGPLSQGHLAVTLALLGHIDQGRLLADEATLVVYGPFNIGGRFTSPSNADFEQWLKSRDPKSGIRDLEAVQALAENAGLRFVEKIAMPANNFCLVWKRG